MLNWLIIGSGDVVDRLLDDSLFVKNKSQVVAIYSKDKLSARRYALKHNIKYFNLSLESIINLNLINSAYIASPPSSHLFYIKKFAKLGINIFCEKPIVSKLNDIKIVKSILKNHKINFTTAYYRRGLKRFIYIKKLIDQNKIGEILFFKISYIHTLSSHPTAPIKFKKNEVPWRFKKNISGGGNFLDMGTHTIDMVQFLIGDIKNIQGFKNNKLNIYDVEETFVANIILKNKIIGSAIWSSVGSNNEDYFYIVGTKGHIKFSMSNSDKVEIKINNKIMNKNIAFEKPYHSNIAKEVISIFLKHNKEKKYTNLNGVDVIEKQLKALY